jgi:hypothetical protein
LADFVKDRGGSPENTKSQDRAKENFERNVPPWIRDGKDAGSKDADTKNVRVTFDANTEKTIVHGLKRRPHGWLAHSFKGTGHSLREVSATKDEIVLVNDFLSAGELTCGIWIW